jgi:hypothetical protein
MILEIFDSVTIKDKKIDLEQMGIKGPTSTRTYLVHDGTENDSTMGFIGDLVLGLALMLNFLFNRKKRRK